MTDGRIADVATRCLRAYETADREAFAALLHPDYVFTSPQDAPLDADGFFRDCWGGAGRLTFDALEAHPLDGERCLVVYSGTWPDGTRLRNTEILTVDDGLVRRAEVFFGRPPAAD